MEKKRGAYRSEYFGGIISSKSNYLVSGAEGSTFVWLENQVTWNIGGGGFTRKKDDNTIKADTEASK